MPNPLKRWLPLVWLSIAGLAAWVLVTRLRTVAFGDVLSELQALPGSIVIAGIICSTGVYVSIGLYEGIAVRLATGRSMRWHAFRTGITANPIGRAIGVAMVSGGALRYRMYAPAGLSIGQVGAVVLLISMPYFFGVGWLIDLSLLFHVDEASTALRAPVDVVIVLGILGLMKDIGWLAFVWRQREPIVMMGQQLKLPDLRGALVQIAFGFVQISMMTAILYLFMPPELGMSWPAFIPIYCIAFVAGQLSNVPVGLGVLEAALLLMLPQVPPAKLLGAVVAYRAVYEILPLLAALASLLIYESTHPA
ncbi:MAG: lysylphosphatidylglycerol synthase transmembrane domain-containing protein, partial [Steroidobacteraceae bacterium]